MKPILIYKIIFISLLFSFASIAQYETEVLAKIGSDKITVEEFQNRFDYMPHLNYSSTNLDSIKKEFLYSLISEKLWYIEAYELGVDTIESIKLSLNTLEKLFVKDELYKKEIESKIQLTEKDISTGLSYVNRILKTLIITNQDSGKIWIIYNGLSNGASFDSLKEVMKLPTLPTEINYGSLENEELENILFSLKLNEISTPIKSKENWFIFKLVDDQIDPAMDPSKDHARNIVIKKIRDRKSQKLGRAYLDNLLAGKSITADRALFDLLSYNLLKVLKARTGKTEYDSLLNIQLLESDIRKVLSIIDKSDLDAGFINLDEKAATINEFLNYAAYQKTYFNSFNTNKFKHVLNKVVKKFIEDEIIARNGFNLGLNNLSSVKNDLQIWKNYYYSEVLMSSYADSINVTNGDIENYLNPELKDSDKILVNILEVFTKDIKDAENVLSELADGKDFEYIARLYNQRELTKESNGEWGLFNPSKAGEIGKYAVKLDIGQIYGPIKVNGGYSIFKLIDKQFQNASDKLITDKDSLKFIRIKIALSKMDNLINQKTVSLAGKYKVQVDEQLLKKVETSQLNTFTYRLIGFGGKIAAFPLTIPMYEWYNMYQQKKEIP